MVRFTQTQKDEFDTLKSAKGSLSLFNVLLEIQNNEKDYPVLYYSLFSDDDSCKNQDDFAQAWSNPDLITVDDPLYYLVILPDNYVSLDPDGNVTYTKKDDYTLAYQKQFTQAEINRLQQNEAFKNKMSLDNLKVEVNVDDANDKVDSPENVTVEGSTISAD